jgi:CHAT domain-containing protein
VRLECRAVHDPVRPRLSGLVFADGEEVVLEEIARLRIAADLVVLPACETAGGPPDAVSPHLARAFHCAGADRVIANLWRVDPGSAAVLLEAFEASASRGASIPRALAEAKRALLRSLHAHPHHWAAFTLHAAR